jgi:hypothetical protein
MGAAPKARESQNSTGTDTLSIIETKAERRLSFSRDPSAAHAECLL